MSDTSDTGPVPGVEDVHPPLPDTSSNRLAGCLITPLVVAFLVVVLVFYVLFGVSRVVGPSMLPTLREQDGLLLTKGYSDPRRGDIVVLTATGQNGTPEEVVKRVIGLPGDTVVVTNDVAYVNGKAEPALYTLARVSGAGDDWGPAKIPDGKVLVLGDNRPVSYDGRYFGLVDSSAITGRAVAIYMPVTRVRGLARLPADAFK